MATSNHRYSARKCVGTNYIHNFLADVIKRCIKLYADDVKLFSVVNHQPQKVEVQQDVWKSETWAIDLHMFFNISKCKHLHIGREDNTTDYDMVPNKEEIKIKKVNGEKHLGVVTDNKLLFREHISSKVSTESKILYFHLSHVP